MYGDGHPYANQIAPEDYDKLDREQLIEFYKDRYAAENCKIYIAGNVTPQILAIIRDNFSKLPTITTRNISLKPNPRPLESTT